jgi:uncharacterized protein YkwD
VLLVASLVTGGLAQWGWGEFSGPRDGRASLAVAGPGTSREGGTAQNADRTGAVPSAPASSSATPTRPGKRSSRGADRTTAPSPTPRTAKPAPKPTATTARKPTPKPAATTDERTAIETEVISLTNAQRTKHGCAALRPDDRLRDAARKHSDDMKARGYFDHVTPDGVDPWARAKVEGYTQPSGENIARGQPDAKAVVDAWMNSAGHRANILNCDSKAIGVGVTLGGNGPHWTQMFGFV